MYAFVIRYMETLSGEATRPFLARLCKCKGELVLCPSNISLSTVKILKIGTHEIITIIVLHLERLDFTVQYCVQKMQTEYQTE